MYSLQPENNKRHPAFNSSVIVTYYHSGECRRGVFSYFIYHDHDHLYLSVDGRGFKLNIILDEQSMFYTILQKVIRSFFFFVFFVHFTVSAVVQAVNT